MDLWHSKNLSLLLQQQLHRIENKEKGQIVGKKRTRKEKRYALSAVLLLQLTATFKWLHFNFMKRPLHLNFFKNPLHFNF